jgi:hypothetical protein
MQADVEVVNGVPATPATGEPAAAQGEVVAGYPAEEQQLDVQQVRIALACVRTLC